MFNLLLPYKLVLASFENDICSVYVGLSCSEWQKLFLSTTTKQKPLLCFFDGFYGDFLEIQGDGDDVVLDEERNADEGFWAIGIIESFMQ